VRCLRGTIVAHVSPQPSRFSFAQPWCQHGTGVSSRVVSRPPSRNVATLPPVARAAGLIRYPLRQGGAIQLHAGTSKICDCDSSGPVFRYQHVRQKLDRSTLAEWVGGSSRCSRHLVEVLRRYVMAAGKLHADDTPVPVLAPGLGKTKTGRLWTYVRDDRSRGRQRTSCGVVRIFAGSQG